LIPPDFSYSQICFPSKDGTSVPMYLVGRRDVLKQRGNPTDHDFLRRYGRLHDAPSSVSSSPFLMERGCLFALPSIRGGSEFGVEWHNAAKRRNRQTAYDRFPVRRRVALQDRANRSRKAWYLWRLEFRPAGGRGFDATTRPVRRRGLHGPDARHAPLSPLRQRARLERGFGTVEDPDDFAVLAKYSPYHQVRDGVA